MHWASLTDLGLTPPRARHPPGAGALPFGSWSGHSHAQRWGQGVRCVPRLTRHCLWPCYLYLFFAPEMNSHLDCFRPQERSWPCLTEMSFQKALSCPLFCALGPSRARCGRACGCVVNEPTCSQGPFKLGPAQISSSPVLSRARPGFCFSPGLHSRGDLAYRLAFEKMAVT